MILCYPVSNWQIGEKFKICTWVKPVQPVYTSRQISQPAEVKSGVYHFLHIKFPKDIGIGLQIWLKIILKTGLGFKLKQYFWYHDVKIHPAFLKLLCVWLLNINKIETPLIDMADDVEIHGKHFCKSQFCKHNFTFVFRSIWSYIHAWAYHSNMCIWPFHNILLIARSHQGRPNIETCSAVNDWIWLS